MASRFQLQRALLDAATVLSSAANIARRAAASIDGDAVASGSGSGRADGPTQSTPWPSQSIALHRHQQHVPDRATSAPPIAPDGTPTEMKVVNPGAVDGPASGRHDELKDNDELIQRLDEGLKRYFGEPEPDPREGAQGESVQGPGEEGTAGPTLPTVPQGASPLQDEKQAPESSSATTPSPHSGRLKSPLNSVQPNSAPPNPAPPNPIPPNPAPPETNAEEYDATLENAKTPLRAAKVPSSRIARLLHYGSLGAGLAWGAAGSYVRGEGSQAATGGKQFMSDDNVRRLVDKLSTMRGAALKLGQFMSIQDSNLLPEQIEQVMLRVQNSANYMPAWQMEKVMREDLGSEWRSSFASFNDVPFASASIGQVHAATLSEDHPSPLAGQKVAVKVQFPGVRESIGSDLSNLRWLVSASALLPRGLFLDNTIRVMRRELDDECDYEREKEMGKRFAGLLNGQSGFAVPRVVDELCSKRVLTCEMMKGRPLTQAARYGQEKRDEIARAILELSLRELFTFRLMQTDPNWTNFLYNEQTGKIELIDFGATREYDKAFMDDWLCMLRAAIGGQREECVRWSQRVGYLTGEETQEMRDAHVDSMIALGEPFRPDAPDPYPFANQTITARVRAQIPLMLRQRLTPPPEPTYSLNRKLSGAFLLCARLQANVECRSMLQNLTADYKLTNGDNSRFGQPSGSVASVGLGKRSIHTFRGSRILDEEQQGASQQKSQRRGNLAARWPRHIVEAVAETESRDGQPDSFTTLASTPVAPSLSSVPPEPTGKMDARQVDLQARPVGGEKEGADAESPVTAMDIAMNRGRAKMIRGVSIPAKPAPPGPEDCCMSGCARCVYDLHFEDLQDYQHDLTAARSRLLALSPPLQESEWDVTLLGERPREQDGQDGRSAGEKAQDEVDAVIGNLDPSMKAFIQLERSLKKNGKHATSGE